MPESHPARPYPLGVTPRDGGADVAVFAGHAERVQLCLLDVRPDGTLAEERVDLPAMTHGVWHGFVPGVEPGQRYGFRVHGPWEPRRGHRHNPSKLLLDPYARVVLPPAQVHPEVYGHPVGPDLAGDPGISDRRDSAPFAPHGVVAGRGHDWGQDAAWQRDTRPRIPWSDTVLYEAHVRGLTRALPALPEELRGTYAGLGHPATIEHLVELGVTTVELLPVHAFLSEPGLGGRGLSNYWGYNTLGFFAPHAPYAAAFRRLPMVGPTAARRNAALAGPPGTLAASAELLAEFRRMVHALHSAGLEVVLDVVYNHTCEGGVAGPMLSWRGIDAASYYRLDGEGRDYDTTGCGNSLDARQVPVVRMVLDSLRYWVEEMHVDGFRFDLAPTLARGRDGFDPDHPMLVAMRTDPVLSDVKLIAEPWDIGPHGWRTGQFPPPFAEWNDRYRDGVREFWLRGAGRVAHGEPGGGVRDLATRLAGSADTFPARRGPLASINFITAHDGFTMADCVAYDHKHNLANGEGNRDGSDNNRSWNHGVEGATRDRRVLAARGRSIRNLMGTLLLSTGVPMITGGDELGRTQHGNNNAYCQDNPISWLTWDLLPWQRDLLTTTRYLVKLRRDYPVLRRERFFAGRAVRTDGVKDVAWYGPEGAELDHYRWQDGSLRTLQMLLYGGRTGSLLLIIHGDPAPSDIILPDGPWAGGYWLLWDSAHELPPHGRHAGQEDLQQRLPGGSAVRIGADSIRVYRADLP